MAAPTVVKNGFFSVGNKKQGNFTVTLGDASGVFDTGLAVIDHVTYAPKSMATVSVTLKPNLSSSATSVNGRLSINSGASGDDIFITVYGK